MTDTNTSNETSTNSSPIIKRGGIGFGTALILSLFSVVGGAYSALYINAHPERLQKIGLGAIIPKAQSIDFAQIEAMKADIANIKAHIEKETKHSNQAIPNNLTQPNTELKPGENLAQTPNTQTPNSLANNPPQALPAPNFTAEFAPIKAEMAGLSGRLTAIETRLAALDPTGTGGAVIAALQTEIATLKVTLSDLSGKVSATPSPAVTFAVISLAEAANQNGAFIPEFESVRAALPNLPEVAALEQLSKTGAPNRNSLAESFSLLEATIADTKPKEEKGFLAWFKNFFAKAFKVDVKSKDKNGPEQIFARAKIKLNQGDLSGAINDLRSLQSPSPEIMDWIASADKRVDIEAKIAALRGALERGLSVQPANSAIMANPSLQNTAPAIGNNANDNTNAVTDKAK